jgi:hypothetical protein
MAESERQIGMSAAHKPSRGIDMTREQWLKMAEAHMQPWITQLGYVYPANTRVSCGFPKSSKGKNNSIGQCWTSAVSEDKTHEMFICPTQANPLRVCDILLHEMVHATIGVEHGHKRPFIKLARWLGLEGKITATVAGKDLGERIAKLLAAMPPYPHAPMHPTARTAPKQVTALLKVACPHCGYIARVTAKWLDTIGAPICPCQNEPMERV